MQNFAFRLGLRGDVPLFPHRLRRAEEPDGRGLRGAGGADLPLPVRGEPAGGRHHRLLHRRRLQGRPALPLHPHLYCLRAGTHL